MHAAVSWFDQFLPFYPAGCFRPPAHSKDSEGIASDFTAVPQRRGSLARSG